MLCFSEYLIRDLNCKKKNSIRNVSKNYTIALVGLGPRGLAALEALYLAKQKFHLENEIRVVLFEKGEYPGAGQIWSPDQVGTNLSNIHERRLRGYLSGRPQIKCCDLFIPAFPGYEDWLENSEIESSRTIPDSFPSRAKLGSYLNNRFDSLKNALKGNQLIRIYKTQVTKVETTERGCVIYDNQKKSYAVDQLVLTIGHQPTQLSSQLKSWEKHVMNHPNLTLFTDPYPVRELDKCNIDSQTTVALRGFGLSMLDQVREFTIGFGGRFENQENSIKLTYIPSKKEPKKLIAFSLDGLPPAPKPINEWVDSWFELNESERKMLQLKLDFAAENPAKINDAGFLIEALASITASVFIRLGNKARTSDLSWKSLTNLTEQLIREPHKQHSLILSTKCTALEQMEALLEMAYGKRKISLDYCLGQVWRFALGIIYHDYTYLHVSDAAMEDVVNYIEASKRYSYGPPVTSLQQLIALEEAGILDLDFVNNPDISLVNEGWELRKKDKTCVAEVMVNSVIDAPQLLKVSSSLIKNLIEDKKVDPVSYKLGLHTLEDGRIITKAGTKNQHIALLGRLAKGSVIGVDDLIECFGKPARLWAEGVLKRFNEAEN